MQHTLPPEQPSHFPSQPENSSCQEVPPITFRQLNHVTSPLSLNIVRLALKSVSEFDPSLLLGLVILVL